MILVSILVILLCLSLPFNLLSLKLNHLAPEVLFASMQALMLGVSLRKQYQILPTRTARVPCPPIALLFHSSTYLGKLIRRKGNLTARSRL